MLQGTAHRPQQVKRLTQVELAVCCEQRSKVRDGHSGGSVASTAAEQSSEAIRGQMLHVWGKHCTHNMHKGWHTATHTHSRCRSMGGTCSKACVMYANAETSSHGAQSKKRKLAREIACWGWGEERASDTDHSVYLHGDKQSCMVRSNQKENKRHASRSFWVLHC